MSDWATKEAAKIVEYILGGQPSAELQAWLAAKLRVIHQQGVGEGMERLGKALTPEQVQQ